MERQRAAPTTNDKNRGETMRPVIDILLTLLLPSLILIHLLLSPYTKVEESFNLQATHDILTYGVPTRDVDARLRARYDHFQFPGAVPRTFTGALVLAAFSRLGIWLGGDGQLVVRGVLGMFNASALLFFREAIARSFGATTGNWYLLLQAGQFHVIYYASRTLPNMFAFGLTTFALGILLPVFTTSPAPSPRENDGSNKITVTTTTAKRCRLAVYIMTFTAVVFRAEIALLLLTQTAYILLWRAASLHRDILPAGIAGAVIGLLVTVSVDSFFWQQVPLWPELAGFFYNAVQGRAVAWGTSPWWFYFVRALPRLLLNPFSWLVCMPLALGAPATRRRAAHLLAPLLAFVALYSFQPHKEWRFVVYVVPGFTAVAALGATAIWRRRRKPSLVYRLLALALVLSTLAAYTASFAMLAVSRLNYPGAEALRRVHQLGLSSPPSSSSGIIRIHMDTLSCTTGITRFLQIPPSSSNHTTTTSSPQWIYDKSESPKDLANPLFWTQFDFRLTESPPPPPDTSLHHHHDPDHHHHQKIIPEWEVVDIISAFDGWEILRPGSTDTSTTTTSSSTSGSSSGSDVLCASSSGWGWWCACMNQAERFLRGKKNLTRGWWVRMRIRPMIWIMRKKEEEEGLM